jgi:hypothetical protein
MPPRDLTAEDIANWLTPRQAIQILSLAVEQQRRSNDCIGRWLSDLG